MVALQPLPPPQPRVPPIAAATGPGQAKSKRSVRVHIGTVEVKAPPPAAPMPASAEPQAPRAQGFDDYAALRSFWRHGW